MSVQQATSSQEEEPTRRFELTSTSNPHVRRTHHGCYCSEIQELCTLIQRSTDGSYVLEQSRLDEPRVCGRRASRPLKLISLTPPPSKNKLLTQQQRTVLMAIERRFRGNKLSGRMTETGLGLGSNVGSNKVAITSRAQQQFASPFLKVMTWRRTRVNQQIS